MIQTNYMFNNKPISYELNEEEGSYIIYLDGQLWIAQYPPYIPYPELSLKECCLKQIADICTIK